MLKLAAMFSDNMVLQRDIPVPIWGWALPGASVEVRFANQTKSATADADGYWKLLLDSLHASSTSREIYVSSEIAKSHILQISHSQNRNISQSQHLQIKNVLVGEVWLCSGQSNMEFAVCRAKDGDREKTEADFPGIRLLNIPKFVAITPRNFISACSWEVCNPETVSEFSAVGYFFGRELHRRLGVPVGLINASWGGTVAEAWTSRNALLENQELSALVTKYEMEIPNPQELIARCEKESLLSAKYKKESPLIGQRTKDVENLGYPRAWADVTNPPGEWKDMELPSAWQSRGLDFSGVLWFRKEIELPEGWDGKELCLSIGATDKSDTTYFNNVKVGGITMADRQDSWCTLRSYVIPANLAKPAKNMIAVRVHSDKYGGGMTGPATEMRLSCPALPESAPVQLSGIWKYAVESNYGKIEIPVMTPPNYPSLLFNAMIFPLIPYAIRGAIWYQGEANASRASQYRILFPAMIQDWRKHWNQGEFHFLFVQLPNYGTELSNPAESEWADLREAQTMALQLPKTGMAVAIDIGDARDIHPANKQDVGLRLTINALARVYGQQVPYSGPMFKSMTRECKSLRIYFDHINGKLECRGEKLLGFAIAGADRKFVWAQGEINNESVIVSSSAVPDPKYVRYAWADNPLCNLYDSVGMPANPFRTDNDDRDTVEIINNQIITTLI
jgi:sialate O-acetylesterase